MTSGFCLIPENVNKALQFLHLLELLGMANWQMRANVSTKSTLFSATDATCRLQIQPCWSPVINLLLLSSTLHHAGNRAKIFTKSLFRYLHKLEICLKSVMQIVSVHTGYIILWRVGRGREPWERSEAGGVIGNERHLHHSPVSSPTEELRKG